MDGELNKPAVETINRPLCVVMEEALKTHGPALGVSRVENVQAVLVETYDIDKNVRLGRMTITYEVPA
jgi:hypothetical protein